MSNLAPLPIRLFCDLAMAASNCLVAVNTNTLAADHYIWLAPMTNGSNPSLIYSNTGNCIEFIGSNCYVGLQIVGSLTAGGNTNNSTYYPGCVPAYDVVAIYGTTNVATNTQNGLTAYTWPFLGFLGDLPTASHYPIISLEGLAYNSNDGLLYALGIDGISRIFSGGASIFAISPVNGQVASVNATTNLTQSCAFIPWIGKYALSIVVGATTYTTATYDLSGSNFVFGVDNRQAIVLSGNGGISSQLGVSVGGHDTWLGVVNMPFISTNASFDNTAVGFEALYGQGGGQSFSGNTAVGSEAMANTTAGGYNVAVGAGAMQALNGNSWTANVAVGASALGQYTALYYDTAVGYGAGNGNASGDNAGGISNIFIGYEAGQNIGNNDQNIDVGHPGVFGDSGVTRLGQAGYQTTAWIAGNVIATNGGFTSSINTNHGAITHSLMSAVGAWTNSTGATIWANQTANAVFDAGGNNVVPASANPSYALVINGGWITNTAGGFYYYQAP
jgi:hypothetical protein